MTHRHELFIDYFIIDPPTAVIISCKNLNGGFRNSLSVSTGFLMITPSESCVFLIVAALTSVMIQISTKSESLIYWVKAIAATLNAIGLRTLIYSQLGLIRTYKLKLLLYILL